MRKLLTIIALLFSMVSFAQPTKNYPILGAPKTTTYAQGWLRCDSGFVHARKDTTVAPVLVGEVRYRTADSTLYIAKSTTSAKKWYNLSPLFGVDDITATANRQFNTDGYQIGISSGNSANYNAGLKVATVGSGVMQIVLGDRTASNPGVDGAGTTQLVIDHQSTAAGGPVGTFTFNLANTTKLLLDGVNNAFTSSFGNFYITNIGAAASGDSVAMRNPSTGKIGYKNINSLVSGGSITSPTSGIANAETKIVSSLDALPASRLIAGTVIEFTLHGTCTSTAAGVGVVHLRYGTTGTVASDADMMTFTLAAAQTSGTTIPFTIRGTVTIRSTGGSATSDGELDLVNSGTTGLSTTATQVVRGSSSTINTTTASTFFTLSYISGNANTTSTFQDAKIVITYK